MGDSTSLSVWAVGGSMSGSASTTRTWASRLRATPRRLTGEAGGKLAPGTLQRRTWGRAGSANGHRHPIGRHPPRGNSQSGPAVTGLTERMAHGHNANGTNGARARTGARRGTLGEATTGVISLTGAQPAGQARGATVHLHGARGLHLSLLHSVPRLALSPGSSDHGTKARTKQGHAALRGSRNQTGRSSRGSLGRSTPTSNHRVSAAPVRATWPTP